MTVKPPEAAVDWQKPREVAAVAREDRSKVVTIVPVETRCCKRILWPNGSRPQIEVFQNASLAA